MRLRREWVAARSDASVKRQDARGTGKKEVETGVLKPGMARNDLAGPHDDPLGDRRATDRHRGAMTFQV